MNLPEHPERRLGYPSAACVGWDPRCRGAGALGSVFSISSWGNLPGRDCSHQASEPRPLPWGGGLGPPQLSDTRSALGSRGCPGLLGRFAPKLSHLHAWALARRRERWDVQENGTTAPLFGNSSGADRRHFPRQRRRFRLPPRLSQASLPALICLHAHVSAAAASLASLTPATLGGCGPAEPTGARDYLLELQQSLCRRKTFNHGESILLDLCTPATLFTSSLGFSFSFPHLAHLWGTVFASAGARRADGDCWCFLGSPRRPPTQLGTEPAGLEVERASGFQEPDPGI